MNTRFPLHFVGIQEVLRGPRDVPRRLVHPAQRALFATRAPARRALARRHRVRESSPSRRRRRRAPGDEVECVSALSVCRPSRPAATPSAAATSAVRASATGRTAGPERPPLPCPEPRRSGDRIDSRRPKRVDQGERIRAAVLRRLGDRPDLRDVGRQLHDQRLRGQRADPVHERPHLPRLAAHDASRLHVRAGDVQLQRRNLAALATACTRVANSSCENPATLTIRGRGEWPARADPARGTPPAPCSGGRSS